MSRFHLDRCAPLLTATLIFCATSALANGRFPATNAVVVQPGNPKTIALRATFGLVVSKDEGASWDWICERAMGYSGNEDPSVTLTSSGAMIVGAFEGTSRSSDGGCHWSHDVAWPTSVIDLTTRPQSGDRVYAVTNAFSKMSDGGSFGYVSRVSVSENAGVSWSVRSTLDPTLLIDSIEVAPNDAKRAYVSAVRVIDGAPHGVLLVSDDDAAHWKELEIKLIAQERGAYIAAVDPENAARIYVRTASADTSRLLVSDNAGKSFEIMRGGLLHGFALADDGATVFAGDATGLSRAPTNDNFRFDHVSSTPIQCLTSIGTSLWACAPTNVGWVLGASTDKGATFASKLKLDGMRGPLRCAAPSAMDDCAADWSALTSLLGPAPIANIDAPVASTSSAASTPKHSIFSCALEPIGAEDDRWAAAFALVGFAFLTRRKTSVKQA